MHEKLPGLRQLNSALLAGSVPTDNRGLSGVARGEAVARRPFAVLPAATALARVPLLPSDPYEAVPPSAEPLLIEGMFLASRPASAALAQAGQPADDSRLTATVRGYEIRARTRPTPHGVFAGVALACFSGEVAGLQLGAGHRTRSNPAPGWLAAVCAEVLDDPGVLPLLTFTASNLVTRRGGRLETEQQATAGTGPRRITVRATDATVLIMDVCRAGAAGSRIYDAVIRRWAAVTEQVVSDTIRGLVRGGFLLTDLLPGDVSDDPLGHLLARLPADSPRRAALARLRRVLADADGHRPGEPARLEALTAARDLADEIAFCDRPLSVDVAADACIVLPAALADEAGEAAGVLWRTCQGPMPLASYHDRFLDRYGPLRFVPLLEAADTAIGVGLDGDAGRHEAPAVPPGRLGVLAALLTRAAAQCQDEVVLDAPVIAALAGDQTTGLPPRTAEILVRVLAATEADLAAGRLFLAVCPEAGSQVAGSTAGRFASLLAGGRTGWDTQPHALIAEVAVRPRVPGGATLAPGTGFASWRIPVGVPPQDGDLALDDLLLASDGGQLIVWSARQDRQVIPVLYSRLTPRLLPPLARFLGLLGQSGCLPWRGWSWGPLADGLFQPRVRYGRIVLAPARWVLPPAVTATARDRTTWDQALDNWRASTVPPLPGIVVTDDADRRIPLDLYRPDDRELLRRYVRRGLAAVTEQPGGPGAIQAVVPGPAGRYVLELVIPLASTSAAPTPARPAAGPARAAGAGLHLPGGEWLSLAIRSPTSCQDEILVSLAAVAAGLARHWDRWFWLRYHDDASGPHVRARFHGHPAALGGHVLPAISAWCAGMIRQRLSGGFTVEPYDQEIERYGGADSIIAAEQLFAADSHLVMAVLAGTADPDKRLVIAALSAADIARTVAAGDSAALHDRRLDRATRQRLVPLRPQVRAADREPDTPWPILGPADPAWLARENALIAYRDTLKHWQRTACASAVIHMHANRLLGGTPTEPLARALAADLIARPR
jgi:lantibiotic biosynthesis protein